jgi:hypothetical protein
MTEPGGQRTEHRREKPPIPSFGMKINVQRVVDYNCERGRSAKSVKRLEVTLAAYRCHCTLSTVEGLKSFGERGAWRTWTPGSRGGFLSVDFTRLFKVIVAAPEKGFDG